MTSPPLREKLRLGILGEGWRLAALSVLLVVAIIGTNLIYDSLNHGPNRILLRTGLDASIPLVPVFAIPYVSLIPFIGASLLAMMLFNGRVFRSAALSMIAAWLVSYAFYFFLQSYVARPSVTGSDVFSSLVRSIYASDAPFNDFPSLHTSLSMIIAIHWWHIDRRIGIPVAVWTALIVASTMLVHQHYVADVALGIAVAVASSWLFVRLTRAYPARSTRAGRPLRPR
jgi:membrane-associated phospholipid phosphatase